MPRRTQYPFTIVVDTREKKEYTFENMYSSIFNNQVVDKVPVIHKALPVGDYAIDGCPECVIERKSKNDLYGSVSKRDNFRGRLEKMACLSWAAVVVEEQLDDLLDLPPKQSKLPPRALHSTILSWSQLYINVHWWFRGSRRLAEICTLRLLEQYYKHFVLKEGRRGKSRQGNQR